MKRLLLLLAAALLAITVSGCGQGAVEATDEHAGEEAAEGEHVEDIVLTAEAAEIAGIEVAEARMMPMQRQLEVPGTVTNTSRGRAVVTPPVGGKVTRLHVKMGDRVTSGQPVATLQSADLAEASAAVIEAQAGVLSAEADVREVKSQIELANSLLKSARETLSRQKDFAKTGAFSQPSLQAAQRELADAEAELERGKQDQAVHEAQLERAERLYKQELISRTELEQARLEVATDKIRQRNAERRIELAKATFEREQQIATQNLANAREIQTAEAEVRAADLEVRQAKIRYASAIARVASANKGLQAERVAYSALAGGGRASGGTLTVTAPIGGIVGDIEVSVGQAVERATEICSIENLRTVWVVANVPDKQIALARKGARAQITVSAFPGRIFPGVVQVVGTRLDPKNRTMPVQVIVENASGELRADMFASVSLGVGASSRALAVPSSAIVADGDRKLLYIAEDGGKYEERVVETGRVQGDLIEIVSGLDIGDRVVVKGAFVLKSEKVKAELKGHEH